MFEVYITGCDSTDKRSLSGLGHAKVMPLTLIKHAHMSVWVSTLSTDIHATKLTYNNNIGKSIHKIQNLNILENIPL